MLEQLKTSLDNLKQKKPLVLCLTNYVTMDFMANSLLALGAAPLMSESMAELEELTSISNALYINIGTLNDAFMERALFAAKIAQNLQLPVVLDPVGAGASTLRTSAALELLTYANIIRGNASEIISLSGAQGKTKGVESTHQVDQAATVATALAKNLGKVIIVSGAEDFVTDGRQEQKLSFGSNLMPLITGMGCTLTAVISAFAAVNPNRLQAAIDATAYFSLCGQAAERSAKAPGTFRVEFINNLFNPDWDYFKGIVNYAK